MQRYVYNLLFHDLQGNVLRSRKPSKLFWLHKDKKDLGKYFWKAEISVATIAPSVRVILSSDACSLLVLKVAQGLIIHNGGSAWKSFTS